ncbi:MAG TPA: 30S ribosomal protein S16 [Candidatus Paceibacterota bacterium]
MLMIRFQRIGRTNDPAYRISVLEKARAARAGRIVEDLGSYNPRTKAFALDETRTKEWMARGAQPTDTVRNLFIAKGVMTGSQVDVFPSSARRKAVEAEKKAAADAAQKAATDAAAAAAVPVAEAAPLESPVVESEDGAGPSIS